MKKHGIVAPLEHMQKDIKKELKSREENTMSKTKVEYFTTHICMTKVTIKKDWRISEIDEC